MKYFTIEELSRSTTARAKNIDNTPSGDVCENLAALVEELLDPVRQAWGAPITINSGYRCPALNAAVGGVATSQHTKGQAADITAGDKARNKLLFNKIVEMRSRALIDFDQLIDEADYKWVHISYRRGANRSQVLHL